MFSRLPSLRNAPHKMLPARCGKQCSQQHKTHSWSKSYKAHRLALWHTRELCARAAKPFSQTNTHGSLSQKHLTRETTLLKHYYGKSKRVPNQLTQQPIKRLGKTPSLAIGIYQKLYNTHVLKLAHFLLERPPQRNHVRRLFVVTSQSSKMPSMRG